MRLMHSDPVFFAVLFGFLLDLAFGDPRWLYHPVRLIGKLITGFEKLFRRLFGKGKTEERTAGVFCALSVLTFSTLVPLFLLRLFYRLNFWAGFLLETFWCYQLLAVRSLREESMKVYRTLRSGDLAASRRAVSMIVGRDTERLDFAGVTRAAVETVAESTSDGIAAPLLYMALFGAAGGFFYKAVNTMDSMIGYRNDRYRWFGTFAARLDDVLNFIPARAAGILMCLAARIDRFDGKNAWKIFLRDRKKHDSPNSAHTEAAMAGALDLRLAGDAWYFGKLHKKQYLGDPLRQIEAGDIPRANRLSLLTAILALAAVLAFRALVHTI